MTRCEFYNIRAYNDCNLDDMESIEVQKPMKIVYRIELTSVIYYFILSGLI